MAIDSNAERSDSGNVTPHKPRRLDRSDIEAAFANQKGGDDRLDETIVLHIVDVTKDVIVFPPGRDRQKIPVCAFHCLDGRPERQIRILFLREDSSNHE